LAYSVGDLPTAQGDQLRLSHWGQGQSAATEGSGGVAQRPDPAVQGVAINTAMSEVQARIQQLESIVASLNALIAAREQQVANAQAAIAAAWGWPCQWAGARARA
jgi:Tfp pilus assembly protein FimV